MYFTTNISITNITLDGIYTYSVIHVGLFNFRYEYSRKRSLLFADPDINDLLGRYNMAYERLTTKSYLIKTIIYMKSHFGLPRYVLYTTNAVWFFRKMTRLMRNWSWGMERAHCVVHRRWLWMLCFRFVCGLSVVVTGI